MKTIIYIYIYIYK